MINYLFYYWGPLLFHTQIKPKELATIKKLCKKDLSKSHVKNLAGDIKDEYLIDKNKLNNILIPYIDAFKKAHQHWYNKPVPDLKVVTAWVNYMKPGEYEGTTKGPGAITFMYGEENGQAITTKESVPVNGDFFMFPHNLRHMVNPHKSKCERVSLGINFAVKGGIYDK